jgi:hypothetical protein
MARESDGERSRWGERKKAGFRLVMPLKLASYLPSISELSKTYPGEGERGGEFFCRAIAISTFSRLFDKAVSTSIKDEERNRWQL